MADDELMLVMPASCDCVLLVVLLLLLLVVLEFCLCW